MQITRNYLHTGKVVWSEVSFNNSDMNREVHVSLCERLTGRFRRPTRLFANSVEGAEAAAVIYSLIQTCHYQKIESYNYLRYVLAHIQECTTIRQLEVLLPFNIDPTLIK